MKLWVNPVGFEHAKALISNKDVDYVVVGLTNKLSVRNTCLLTIKQLKEINCDKVVVALTNLFVDDQIPTLQETIKQLKQLDVKTIVFTDFAIKQICDELDYHPQFVYNSETLTTNYGQLPFYKQHGINEVMLPRELFLQEIEQFGKNKHDVKLQMQVEGYGLVMHSKWNLLTNFKNQFKLDKDLTNQMFYLKEETRNLPNIIIEDETGSHMFSGYNVSLLEYLDKLYEANIDSITFLSYLHDQNWVDENIAIYTQALKAIKDNKFNDIKQSLIERINKINKVSACGFIDPTKGLLHLDREVK